MRNIIFDVDFQDHISFLIYRIRSLMGQFQKQIRSAVWIGLIDPQRTNDIPSEYLSSEDNPNNDANNHAKNELNIPSFLSKTFFQISYPGFFHIST